MAWSALVARLLVAHLLLLPAGLQLALPRRTAGGSGDRSGRRARRRSVLHPPLRAGRLGWGLFLHDCLCLSLSPCLCRCRCRCRCLCLPLWPHRQLCQCYGRQPRGGSRSPRGRPLQHPFCAHPQLVVAPAAPWPVPVSLLLLLLRLRCCHNSEGCLPLWTALRLSRKSAAPPLLSLLCYCSHVLLTLRRRRLCCWLHLHIRMLMRLCCCRAAGGTCHHVLATQLSSPK